MKNNKNKFDIADLIMYWLFGAGIVCLIASCLWAISYDSTGKSFSRFLLSVICFGFSGVIAKLRKL